MIVRRDHWLPFVPFLDPGLALRLGQQQPLAVQVEPIVIGARFDPHIMRRIAEIGVFSVGPECLSMIDPPRVAVWST